MTPESLKRQAELYRVALLEDVIPFWLKHGADCEHGGILTCLNRDGSVLDTDKSVWFQGRAAWMFATLYNTIERHSGLTPHRCRGHNTLACLQRSSGRPDQPPGR